MSATALLLAAAAGIINPAAITQAEVAFLSAIEDTPLPATLLEQPETLAEIDGPEGRVVSVQALGTLEPAALTAFYDAAMPALGWRRDGGAFVRDRSNLTITFRREGERLRVTFRLIEKPASLRLD